jgi:sugar/nucleoside kinase (ribokinase family)
LKARSAENGGRAGEAINVKRPFDVVCVGNIVADAVGTGVDTIPEEGHLALFDRVEMHLGGCANNTALALAKLGLKVALSAKVGTDGFGDFCIDFHRKAGVNVAGVVRSAKDSTSFSFIMIPRGGNRRILHTLAANETFGPKDMDMGLFAKTKWVCFGGLAIMPALDRNLRKLMTAARKAGAKIAADTAINNRYTPRDWRKLFEGSYELIDVLFPSEFEAQALTGETDPEKICAALRKRGVKIAGVKLGEKGCALMSDAGFVRLPVYPVKCVDTLGAGDAFMAGMLAGFVKGLDPVAAARLGNAVSAHCVQSVGATTGIRALAAIERFQRRVGSR